MSGLDAQEIPIACPECRKSHKKTFAWVKANDHLICSGCNTRINFDKSRLTAPLKKAEKALADLRRAFNKLGK